MLNKRNDDNNCIKNVRLNLFLSSPFSQFIQETIKFHLKTVYKWQPKKVCSSNHYCAKTDT